MPITDYPEGRRTRRIEDPMQNRQAPVLSELAEIKDARRSRQIAEDLKPSEQHEHVGQLAENGHPVAQRIAAGLYRHQQSVARAHGKDV